MAKRYEVCRCSVCGNVVEVVHGGDGVLFCCGRAMHVFSETTVDPEDAPYEPVVERTGEGIKVTVRRVDDELAEEHHIQWIELIADGNQYRRHIKPDELPEALFKVDGQELKARAYCTQKGLCVEQK